MPSITVVIPVYNVENYLEKCVRSVEAQTYRDYQIILVDDGSTDTSGALCDRFAEENENIRVVHQENKGLGGARNTGIDLCDTEYILFLDSDDSIHPSLLEKCVHAAQKDQCDAVFFDMVSVSETGETGAVYQIQAPCGMLLSEEEIGLIAKNDSACDKLFRTSLFKEHGIRFPEKVWYEDLRTVPKLIPYIKKAVRLDSEPLYYYLQRTGSIMHTPDPDRVVAERSDAAEDVTRYFESRGLWGEYAQVCGFIWIYHAFLLPCMEMNRVSGNYKKYLDVLKDRMEKVVSDPLENRYLIYLRKNEKTVLKLALKRHYFIIRCLTAINRKIKGEKNA